MILPPGYKVPAWSGSRRDVSYSYRVRANSTINLFGLIYDVTVQDDPLVRQLILADVLEPELVLDQRENRLVPIELSILTVGCLLNGKIIQGLPPQPPINLDSLMVCDEAELRAFTDNLAAPGIKCYAGSN